MVLCFFYSHRERDALKSETERLSVAMSELGRREGHLKEELDRVTKEVCSLCLVNVFVCMCALGYVCVCL